MTREKVVSRPDRKEWITLHEAAELTGYSYGTLRNYVRLEDAPEAVMHRGKLLVKLSDVISKWGLGGE